MRPLWQSYIQAYVFDACKSRHLDFCRPSGSHANPTIAGIASIPSMHNDLRLMLGTIDAPWLPAVAVAVDGDALTVDDGGEDSVEVELAWLEVAVETVEL